MNLIVDGAAPRKNGSKTRLCSSAGMPGPRSSTRISTELLRLSAVTPIHCAHRRSASRCPADSAARASSRFCRPALAEAPRRCAPLCGTCLLPSFVRPFVPARRARLDSAGLQSGFNERPDGYRPAFTRGMCGLRAGQTGEPDPPSPLVSPIRPESASRIVPLVRGLRASLPCRLKRCSPDHRKGRAQFMRNAGNEIQLQSRQVFMTPGELYQQCGCRRDQQKHSRGHQDISPAHRGHDSIKRPRAVPHHQPPASRRSSAGYVLRRLVHAMIAGPRFPGHMINGLVTEAWRRARTPAVRRFIRKQHHGPVGKSTNACADPGGGFINYP